MKSIKIVTTSGLIMTIICDDYQVKTDDTTTIRVFRGGSLYGCFFNVQGYFEDYAYVKN